MGATNYNEHTARGAGPAALGGDTQKTETARDQKNKQNAKVRQEKHSEEETNHRTSKSNCDGVIVAGQRSHHV